MPDTLVLLGDSIIDNRPYIAPHEPDVTAQLQARLGGWKIVRRATDGAGAREVLSLQLAEPLPEGCLAVVSAGGNDALDSLGLFEDPALETAAVTLQELGKVRGRFRAGLGALLDKVKERARRTLVLTIYDPCFEGLGSTFSPLDPSALQKCAEAGLSVFNDVIQREARARGFDVLELRSIFTAREDFANPIEPSAVGGAKLADAIRDWAAAC